MNSKAESLELRAESQSVQPFRGDFYATDAAHAAVKEAVLNRRLARGEASRSNLVIAHLLRCEMRYYAKWAVTLARRYRASRS